MKRRRRRAETEAGISELPPPILHHILSFLDEKEALKTCLLSKSWRLVVSTRPNFILKENNFDGDKEKFRNVLDKSLQVYYDQKLCIDDFSVSCVSTDDPLLKKWIPIVTEDLGVKKFHLSIILEKSANFDLPLPYFDLPAVVFESESLQEINLRRCKLSQIKSIRKNNHLKTLHLYDVYIKEESFAKLMSSCPLIEHFSLSVCKGLRTINVQNHHNLQRFELYNNGGRSVEIYLPSSVRDINIVCCQSWFRHRNYFPRVTCLHLKKVAMPNEWFGSLSRNFPCLEELRLWNCKGFDELQLSSRSIKKLDITIATKSRIKATFDTPSIKEFHCRTKTSNEFHCHTISFSTTSNKWNSQFRLSLNKKVSLCFLKLSLTSLSLERMAFASNYFRSLTCLSLERVALSNEWFNSFSRNFPCLEELLLWYCYGFDEIQLSSPTIKNLKIWLDINTTKATINTPSIKEFRYDANISQSISFTATTSDEWNSQIGLSLDELDASQWFLKISELVAEFSQSQIDSLMLTHYGHENNQHNIKHLSDISVCCGNSYTRVAMKSLALNLGGLHYDSFFSDLMNGLFRIIRPSEIKQGWYLNGPDWYVNAKQAFPKFLCRTLEMGRWEEEDEGMRSFFLQQDLEQVSLLVETDNNGEWHPVEGITTSWLEYVAALRRPPPTNSYQLRFLLKWREIS